MNTGSASQNSLPQLVDSKNIVLCFDGTGNEFGDRNSNVVKLYRTLDTVSPVQIVYYHPGVGTMGSPSALTVFARSWTKLIGLAFGYGLSQVIADAYAFLMEHYTERDRLYLFGFSRGAYIARVFAAILHMYGLVRYGNPALTPYMIRLLKNKGDDSFAVAAEFKKTFSRECKAHFVGVWDTVNSVGWITDPLTVPFTRANPDVRIGRHAISIDERRCFYRQNLWDDLQPGQDLKQVWFAGVHSDIGGGYPEKESGLAKITLEWMLHEACAAGLRINSQQKDRMLGRAGGNYVSPDPTADMHNSLQGLWRIPEYFPKRYYDYPTRQEKWKIPRGQKRFMPNGASIHESVFIRKQRRNDYATKLPDQATVEPMVAF